MVMVHSSRTSNPGAPRLLALCFVGLLTALLACARGRSEMPISSDSIAGSVGVNVHLHYANTPYATFDLVQSLLRDLRVRHIRDGLIDTTWDEYYKRHNALGKQGIRCVYVTSAKQSAELLAAFPGRVRSDFEGYEAPNEYNNSGDPNWPETLRAFLPVLNRVTKSSPSLGGRSFVIGPSLTQPDAFGKLTGLQQYFDYANLHNYLAGRNPGTPGWGGGGYGSIQWNVDLARGAWDDTPIVTTEIGYSTDADNKQSIPEDIEAKYMPRLILEQLLHRIGRSYIYELIDVGPEISKNDAAFGLARHDGSRKPAYVALKNLIGLTEESGSNPNLKDLPFQLSGETSDVHHLLAERRDGSYFLFFWIEERGFDPDSRKREPVASKAITLSSLVHFRSMKLITFDSMGETSARDLSAGEAVRLTATDTLSVIKLEPAGAR